MTELFEKFKLWLAVALVGIILAWMMFGGIIKTILFWGVVIFGILYLFGTWMPRKLKRDDQ